MILFKASSKSSIYARLLFSVAVLCLLSTVTGCSDDEDPAEIIPDPGSEIYFTKSLDFTSNSGESILSFTTNKDWTIEVSQSGGDVSWCTVFPSKGKAGENEVLVKVAENTGTDDRNATLILTAKELTNRIVVTQKQKDAITLTTAKFEVDKNGGDIEVEVKANVSYEVIIPEQYRSWIHKRTIRPDKCVFGIDKSEEYDKREGEIIFQSGDLKETLKVYQTGGGVLLLSKNEYTVSDKGEQIAVELKSNFDFEVKMPQVDWITTTVTRSVSSHTLYYTIAPNDTYDKREAEIIYYDRTNKSLADTLKIVQVQKDAILLSQKEYDISAKGGTVEILVKSNINYAIHINKETSQWVKLIQNVATKGLKQDKLLLQIEENSEVKSRVGNIVFASTESDLSDTIRVIQEAKQVEEKHVVINVEKAGTLRALLGIGTDLITHLEINGDINGTDLRLIREMAGIDYYGNPTSGQLKELNLTQANICSGGTNYSQQWSSENIANTIPVGCFYGSNITSVLLPLNIRSIGNQAFFGSKKLAHISIPDACRSIGFQSFGVCAFTSINIPQNVTSIDRLAFDRCYNLASINVDSNNRSYSSKGGVLYDKTMETLCYYPAAGKTIISIPYTVKRLNEFAFYDCIYQKEIIISSSVTTIPYGTFRFLPELLSINVDVNNAYFTSIDGVLYDKSLSEIITCPRLMNEVTIPNGIQIISPYAFYSCQNLKTINVPNSVTMTGVGAFNSCHNLVEINFSNGIVSIDSGALYGCKSLTTISLPESIVSIGDGAFSGCENLIKVCSWAKKPPFIGDNVFYRIKEGFVVYVPRGCKERYKNSERWKSFNILEME